MDTVWANMDLECLQNSGTDGILFPKVSEVSDMLLIQKRLGELNFKKTPEIWIMAETPKCVLNLGKILEEFSNIGGIVVGTNDLAKELVLPKQTGRAGLLYALGSIILTAKAYNVITLDGVFNGISDEEGLRSEAEEGKNMGYDCDWMALWRREVTGKWTTWVKYAYAGLGRGGWLVVLDYVYKKANEWKGTWYEYRWDDGSFNTCKANGCASLMTPRQVWDDRYYYAGNREEHDPDYAHSGGLQTILDQDDWSHSDGDLERYEDD